MDGRPDPDTTATAGGSYETFFTETGNGKYVPRSIFVDLDPSVSFYAEVNIGAPATDSMSSQCMRFEQAHFVNSSILSSLLVERRMLPIIVNNQ